MSAGRVVTKMEFDINSPVPRLLFSPVAAVPPEMRDAVARQGKTQAAEAAIKLTVYKTDAQGAEEPEAPAQQQMESVEEPTKRETAKPAAAKADDVQDVLKKWTKK